MLEKNSKIINFTFQKNICSKLSDKYSYNYKIQPKHNNIRDFLDKAMEQEELSVDENDWYSRIRVCTSEWLAA